MTFWTRATSLVTLLAVGCLFQLAMKHHVASAGPLPSNAATVALADIPMVFSEWRGQDRPIDDPRLLLGDQRLRRVYRRGATGPAVEVWVVHSNDGSDRYHHPEICMAVAGQQEDPAGRESVEVPGHPSPVQQYRFGSPENRQLVYYWHYTLLPPPGNGRDALQRLYDRLHLRPASVTLEVFMPEQSPDDRVHAHEFVRLLDKSLREQLPETAVRGRQRAPVTVIN